MMKWCLFGTICGLGPITSLTWKSQSVNKRSASTKAPPIHCARLTSRLVFLYGQ